MILNVSSIRMVATSSVQKILRKQNSCGGGGCQQNILALKMAVHHSALLIIVKAQAYLKLENTDEIIALASAAQKPSRKYHMVVACFNDFGFDYFGVGFDTRGGAACF